MSAQLSWNHEQHVTHWNMIRMRVYKLPRERHQIGVQRRKPPQIRPSMHQKLRALPQIALPPDPLTILLDHPKTPHPFIIHRQPMACYRMIRPNDHHITRVQPALRLVGQRPVSVRALASDRDLRRGARHGFCVEEDMRVEALAAERGEDEFEEV
eukprot:CAMPEP_0174886022 /NCGR_PEP_ID=MMETSP0167-20121228/1291_1 /TAXON_ID=38298 /ORGANISM="Rhodella maculata, Strain CCMP736" /LENGTH=154 /DNA_ID=CAMNT_0016121845 /DNA_START=444 /DNA_END=909 /DNA_ORIENTATION=-